MQDGLIVQIAHPETRGHPSYRLRGQVEACPTGAAADETLRFSALPEPDLQDALATHVEGVKATGYVGLHPIAVLVISSKERLVLAPELVIEAPKQVVATGVGLPEGLYIVLRKVQGHVHAAHS
jgi:hypothetical protein